MLKSEQRSQEFRARAAQAQSAADQALLDNVRERQQHNADRWAEMAEQEEARTTRELASMAQVAAKAAS